MDYISYLNKKIVLTESTLFDFLLSILGKTGLFLDVISLTKNPEMFKDWLEDNKDAYDKAVSLVSRDVTESMVNEGILDYPKNVLIMLIILLRLISTDDAFAGDLKDGYENLKNKYKEYSKDIQDMELDKKFDKVKEKTQPFLDKMKKAGSEVLDDIGDGANKNRDAIIKSWQMYKDQKQKEFDKIPVTPAKPDSVKGYNI